MLVLDNVVKLGGGKRESRVLLESASWLQNETRKTNTGLKLDFPKHCIPSHFTHHCGLQTRIESPVKSASDSERRTRWNIRKTNVLCWDLMRSEGRNLFICGMLWNCPAYVDFPSLKTEFQLLKTFSPVLFHSSCQINPLFPPSSPELPLIPQIAQRWLLQLIHLSQMKETPETRVISADSGTVLGVDPLLGISDFNSLAELKWLKTECPQLVKIEMSFCLQYKGIVQRKLEFSPFATLPCVDVGCGDFF